MDRKAEEWRSWRSFWFAPSTPHTLGVCRFLFFAIVLWQFGRRDFSAFAELDSVFWFPISFFGFFDGGLSPRMTVVVQVFWRIALLLGCLGLLTRFSTLFAWVAGVYLLGFANCFGKISHQPQMIVIILGILAISRCGDAFSLDNLLRRWLHRTANTKELEANGMYTWPIRLVWVVFIFVYFAAGFAKMRASGLAWVLSDNMSNVLIVAHYGTENTWNQLSGFHGRLRFLVALGLAPFTDYSRKGCERPIAQRRQPADRTATGSDFRAMKDKD